MRQGGYLFTGGGTGGHLTPALATAEELRRRDPGCAIHFVGSDRPMERELVGGAGYSHTPLAMASLGQVLRRPWSSLPRMWRAGAAAIQVLRDQRPALVIGCGGFASAPCVWGAWRLGIPVVLLEQNVLPGRATRWLSRLARCVCLSFEASRRWLPSNVEGLVTGNPVRREFAERDGVNLPTIRDTPQLLVLGGSLGARGLNRAVVQMLATDPARWHNWEVLHQTGSADLGSIEQEYRRWGGRYRAAAFLPQPELCCAMRRASIVVTRAGATTLAELACVGAAAVVVPWTGAVDDHQRLNARWYVERGGMLLASEVTPRASGVRDAESRPLADVCGELAADATRQVELRRRVRELACPHAAALVCDIIERTARER